MWIKQASAELRRDPLLLILAGSILLVRLLYLVSYPFHIEGDGETYYALLQDSHAHLLHATGYIFFSLPIRLLASGLGTETANLLPYFQQAFSAASVVVLYLALKRVIPRWISFLVCLPLGIDAQMVAAAGTSRPEFLQADILMLLVSSAVFGLTSGRRREKTIFYLGAGVLGMAGYLTKYNFLPMLAFSVVPLFDAGLRWKPRFHSLVGAALGALALFAIFLSTFHYPTTGSIQLNLEHGWIHLLKLKEADIPILPENGLATRKYIVLSELLPPMAAGPAPWKKINEIPESIRAPFRQKWSGLLATNNPKEVDDALAALPQRRPDYRHPDVLTPIYCFLGLREGEKLLRDVFLEGLRRFPERYLANVRATFVRSAAFSESYMPYLPVPGVYQPSPHFSWARPGFSPRVPAFTNPSIGPSPRRKIWRRWLFRFGIPGHGFFPFSLF